MGSYLFRPFLVVVSIFVPVYVFLMFMVLTPNKTTTLSNGSDKIQTVKISMACNLPKLNPFNPSIMKYVSKPNRPGRCDLNPEFPLLFNTDFDNNLITLKNPRDLGLDKCCYKHLKRPNSENDWSYWESSKCVPLEKNITKIQSSHEFIAVLCATKQNQLNGHKKQRKNVRQRRGSQLRVIDAFAFIHDKPKVIMKDSKSKSRSTTSDLDLNILIIGLDSISHMHFLRSMPKTHEYLTQNLSGIGMHGYVKVGENTFPNLIAAFTGLTKDELKKSCSNSYSVPLDNCSFIWKNFSSKGYWTSYWENEPDIGTFHYSKPGFAAQPTDYFQRPLALYQDVHLAHNGSSYERHLCLGPRHNLRVLLDYAEKMAKMAKDPRRKYFQIIWDSTVAHASPRMSYFGDSLILTTLKYLKEGGFLNNTVLIFMSDHGFDIEGRIFQGLIEARMPFLYFALPDWFYIKYPKAWENLKSNVHRLTTPFDLHETLVDFLSLEDNIRNDEIITRQIKLRRDEMARNLSRGISLFLPIPLSRTCGSASIPIQWCVCHTTHPISTNHTKVKAAAKRFIGFLRYQLKEHRECSTLKLREINNAKIVQIDDRVASASTLNQTAEVMTLILRTVPGNALFEVTLLRRPGGKWRVSSDVRLNRYKGQSDCLAGMNNLRKYCYCATGKNVTK